MSLGLSELGQFRQGEEQEKRRQAITRLKGQQAEALSMSRLVAHPDWEKYGRYVEQQLRRHKKSAETQENRLLDVLNPLDAKEEMKVKAQFAHNGGAIEALEVALNIAQTLITVGEVAVEKIKEVEQAEKIS